ncbi:MAG TPA: acyl-CoA dehydrogenase family protein [Polyangiales bacterium]|jgi:acyl-CoA dehydrogenase|nr:acyl-CoA dehydrogenase family protein [Polyangiales bacterium]
MINLELSEQLQGLEQLMRAVANNVLRPISRKYDKQEHDVPVELAALEGSRRRASGGAKKDGDKPGKREIRNGQAMATVVSIEHMAWGDIGLMMSIPGSGLGNAAIAAAGTPEQKEKFGGLYAAMAITEPASGSDSGSIATTARLEGDEYVLNGEKIFVTAGGRCNAVVVWATLDKHKGKAAIKSFVVPKGTPGMEVVKLEHKLGIRASDTATILFTNCRVPKENLLGVADVAEGKKGDAFGKVMQTFDNTRPGVAAMSIGCARAALDLTLELLAKDGVTLGYDKSVWDASAVEAELYRMEADWEAARLLVLRAAWMADNGEPNSMEASMAKAKAGRVGNAITLRCVELCGALGYSEETLLEKFARDSKILDIFEGTQQIQQLIVARRLLNKSSAELK